MGLEIRKYARRHAVFEHRYILSIIGIWRKNFMSNFKANLYETIVI